MNPMVQNMDQRMMNQNINHQNNQNMNRMSI